MHFRTQIKNATIVNEGRRFIGTLVIDDDRIDEIIEGADSEPVIPVLLMTTFTFAILGLRKKVTLTLKAVQLLQAV